MGWCQQNYISLSQQNICSCILTPLTTVHAFVFYRLVFLIGLFLTFQLLTFQLCTKSLMLRLSKAFLEYFHLLREGISYLIMLLLDGDRLLTWLEVRKIPGSNCNWNSFPLIVVLSCWTICYNLHSPFSQEKSQTCCYNSTARTDSLWVRWLLALLL